MITIRNLGHKPDYVANDVAIAAMEKLAGQPRDLQAIGRQAETRIAALTQTAMPALERNG